MILTPILGHQGGFGVVIVANDIDHPVKVQERDDEACQNFQTVVYFLHPVC